MCQFITSKSIPHSHPHTKCVLKWLNFHVVPPEAFSEQSEFNSRLGAQMHRPCLLCNCIPIQNISSEKELGPIQSTYPFDLPGPIVLPAFLRIIFRLHLKNRYSTPPNNNIRWAVFVQTYVNEKAMSSLP